MPHVVPTTRWFLLTLVLFNSIRASAIAVEPRHGVPPIQFPFGYEAVRGVSLGGWLVTEPWITPSLYDATNNPNIVDEWTFCQYQDYNTAHKALRSHWDTFITEQDIADIAMVGLNHVRIPIGYWAFDISDGEPYHQGQLDYLFQAIGWALQHGVYVMIDLHGLPGSQNGFDNSGRRGPILWDTQASYLNRSRTIVDFLATEFSKPQYGGVVSSIAPVNEPGGFNGSQLLAVTTQYYYDSYGIMRERGSIVDLLHDVYQALTYWNDFMPASSGYSNVMMETHHYELFYTSQLAMSYEMHLGAACARGQEMAAFAHGAGGFWTIAGEFTTTVYDCATYINGRGFGSRWDGTYPGSTGALGSCVPYSGPTRAFSQDYKDFMRKYFEAQTIAFEMADGWIYWTWKTESADEWSYSAGVAGGWIPPRPTQRLYPYICR
ncbi:glycoside hydrolase family 5 protein [Cantharellus anzutake]|uniref:glycoside hydrolase family 5 protein n=1 Tax=Cantharellus anzutake TaxID=1750568 RepID=UPI001905F78D|nr:glycoside hydrolase family 5 protein [Cantharellus anzutake]KAF8335351.1 glycoside hydrolase family 5 protein [Cantharellus anzutake]